MPIRHERTNQPVTHGIRIKRVILVRQKAKEIADQIERKSRQETQVFEKSINLASAIDIVEAAGHTEAELRAAMKDGTFKAWQREGTVRYEISPSGLQEWLKGL